MEDREIIITLSKISVIKATPATLLMDNPQMLVDWSMFLASHLIFVGQETVRAEKRYWQKMRDFRREEKSKVDAEIKANATDEFQEWKELKYLREDMTVLLAILKKVFDEIREEKFLSNKI